MYGKDWMVSEEQAFNHGQACAAWEALRFPLPPMPTGIGDINSDKRGTGARYNAGKMRVDLIPFWIIAAYEDQQFEGELTPELDEALAILRQMGRWQVRDCYAVDVLERMDDPWAGGAAVFDYGSKKYADWNWAKGMPWSVPAACAVRHLLAILRGEQNDPESGLPHIGHVASNLIMLAHFEEYYPEGDDRPNIFRAADEPFVA